MKLSIITILDNTNFGTYLQALATVKVIERLGCEVEIVRYIRPSMSGLGQLKCMFQDRGILSVLRNAWKIPRTIQLRDRDYVFLSKYANVSRVYMGFNSLLANPPCADVYLVGSDQVWNSIYNRGIDSSFYLEYAPQGKRRVSYASSIGMNSFPEKELTRTVELLKKFNYITVREKSAKDLLAKHGVLSEVVLDPTLLLDANEWSSISDHYSMPFTEKYLLVYSVELKKQNQLIDYFARKIAKLKNLKIYQVSYGGAATRLACVDKFFGLATPDVFLNLIRNASFVVVSSFHGTAFSINFHKDFLTISANRFNSRVINLLDLTNLDERLVSDFGFRIEKIKEINYKDVDDRISEARAKSIDILNKILID